MLPLEILTSDANMLQILLIHTSVIPTQEVIPRSEEEAKTMIWKSLKF